MEEENFNWVEEYINIQSGKDVKNSTAYETLINNNIDTNELLGIEKEEGAGTYTVDKNFKPEEANKNEFVNDSTITSSSKSSFSLSSSSRI